MTGRGPVAAVLALALLAGGTAGSLSAAAAAALEVGSVPLQVWDLSVRDLTLPPSPQPSASVDDAPIATPTTDVEVATHAQPDPQPPVPAAIAPDPFEVVVGGAPAAEPTAAPEPGLATAEPGG